MEWIKVKQNLTRELEAETTARSMTEREGMLYRTCETYCQLLSNATHEIMRLELLVDDLKLQLAPTQNQGPHA